MLNYWATVCQFLDNDFRRIFEQLRRQDDKLGSEDEEWDLLAIAFEATVGIKR